MKTTRPASVALAADIVASSGRRYVLARNDRRALCPEVCRALLDHARAVRHERLRESARAARDAYDIAEQLPADCPSRDSLRAEARAELGNAARRLGDFPIAWRLLREARRLARSHPHAAFRAEIATYFAALYAARRRWRLAFKALARAEVTYQLEEDRHGKASALIQRGIYLVYQCEPTAAIPVLRSALLMGRGDPYLVRCALQSLIWALVDAGEAREAHWLFLRAERLFHDVTEAQWRAKIDWLRGRMYAAIGSADAAAHLLEEVRQFFAEEAMPQEAALATLDLALLEAERGAAGAVQRLLVELDLLLSAVGLAPESTVVFILKAASAQPLAIRSIARLVEQGVKAVPAYRRLAAVAMAPLPLFT